MIAPASCMLTCCCSFNTDRGFHCSSSLLVIPTRSDLGSTERDAGDHGTRTTPSRTCLLPCPEPTMPIAKLEHPDMQYRFLGNSGLRVSVISLGGWLTHGGHTGDEIALETIRAAYDRGVNFFDSAEGYAGGRAETLLGRAVKHFGWEREDLGASELARSAEDL